MKRLRNIDHKFDEQFNHFLKNPLESPHIMDMPQFMDKIAGPLNEPMYFKLIPHMRRWYAKYNKQIPELTFYPRIRLFEKSMGMSRVKYKDIILHGHDYPMTIPPKQRMFLYFLFYYLHGKMCERDTRKRVKKEIKRLKRIGRKKTENFYRL